MSRLDGASPRFAGLEHRLKKAQSEKSKAGGSANATPTTSPTLEKAENVSKAAAGFKSLKKG